MSETSLKNSGNLGSPVFDVPSGNNFGTGFAYRRIQTVVGRSVFNERNAPIKPSTQWIYRKCYSDNDQWLYRQDWQLLDKKKYEFPAVYKPKPENYLIKASYIKPQEKLWQKQAYPIINQELSNEIIKINSKIFNKKEVHMPNRLEPEYPKKFKLKHSHEYSEDTFMFNCLLSQLKKQINIFIFSNNTICVTNGVLTLKETTSKSFDTRYFKVLELLYLYDFTDYKAGRDKQLWQPLEARVNNFQFALNLKIDKKLPYKKENCYLNINSAENNSLTNKFKGEKFSFSELENFANFYITAKAASPLIKEQDKQNIKCSLYNLASRKIAQKEQEKFEENLPRLVVGNENIILRYIANNKAIAQPEKKFEQILDRIKFENINSDLSKSIIKPGSTLFKRFKKPRLALRLRINKPAFQNNSLLCKIKGSKEINKNLCDIKLKKIKLKFKELSFVHNSPATVNNIFKKDFSNKEEKFKNRVSAFFNKSRNHVKYTYKLTHKIIFASPFKLSKKIKFSKNAYKSAILNVISKYFVKIKSIKEIEIASKIDYRQRYLISNITLDRSNLRKIIISKKFKNLKAIKFNANNIDKRNKTSISKLKTLKTLIMPKREKDFSYRNNYMLPEKRIEVARLAKKVLKGISELNIIKNSNSVYSKFSKPRDSFENKYTTKLYTFTKYLPKEITPEFNLEITIIGIKTIESLIQKNIIPPPGWEKNYKKFLCKTRLSPYPFGFPDFFFSPPIFRQLVSRSEYGIKKFGIKNIVEESSFILSKNRVFLPELSMKQPRRFLYSSFFPENSPKEFYVIEFDDPQPRVTEATITKEFDYSWQRKNNEKSLNLENSFVMYWKPRLKKFSILTGSPINRSGEFSNIISSNIKSNGMPNITNFILGYKKFFLNKINGKTEKSTWQLLYASNFLYTVIDIIKPNLAFKNYYCSLKQPKQWTLHQSFAESFAPQETADKYIARFRSFHFPYVPEIFLSTDEKAEFTDSLNQSHTSICRFQEDFRLSQFDFISLDLIESRFWPYQTNSAKKGRLQNSFASRELSHTKLNKIYLEPIPNKFNLKNSETPENCQHKISLKFFKIREFLSYKYMVRGRGMKALKYTPMPQIEREIYSYIDLKNNFSNKLETEHYHWVIKLRNTTKTCKLGLCCTFISKTTYYANIATSYRFKNLSKEKYISSTFKSSTIEKPTYKNSRIEIDLSRLPKINVNFDEEVSCNKNHLNLGSIEINRLKNSCFEFSNIKFLDFIQQDTSSKNVSVIETDRLIRQQTKKPLEIKALMAKTKVAAFKSTENIIKRRSNYRPAYLPDFIDVQPYKFRESIPIKT